MAGARPRSVGQPAEGAASVSGDRVLLAAGAATAAIGGLTGAGLPPIRPVKGHIVRLGAPPGRLRPVAAPCAALVHGRSDLPRPPARRDGGGRGHHGGEGNGHVGPGRCRPPAAR